VVVVVEEEEEEEEEGGGGGEERVLFLRSRRRSCRRRTEQGLLRANACPKAKAVKVVDAALVRTPAVCVFVCACVY